MFVFFISFILLRILLTSVFLCYSSREDRDIERALQASLSTMKEENLKKEKVVVKKQEEEFRPTKDSFPSLGGEATPVPATTANSTEVSSLAERFAMANMIPMNYQAQPNSLNDFPSLHQSSIPKSASNPNIVQRSVPSNNIGKSSFKSGIRTVTREEDFPELASGKKPIQTLPGGAWVKPSDSPHNGDTKTSNKSNKVNKNKQSKEKSFSDTNDLFHKVYDDRDFPSLVVKTSQTVNPGWRHIGRTSPISSIECTPCDSQQNTKSQEETKTDLQSVIDRFSPVNVLSDSADKKINKSKNQKKKKKEKDKEFNVVNKQTSKVKNEGSVSLKGNSSLDNIANLLLGSSEQVLDAEQENKHFEEEVDSSQHVEELQREHSPVSFSVENIKMSIPKPEPVKFVVEENEFPALGAPAKVHKPPPGFIGNEEPKTKAPPGFAKPISDNKPPPGFVAKSQTKADSDLDEYNLINSMPLSAHLVDFDNFKYSQPIDFSERNKQLIGEIHSMLADDQFQEFKALSGEFRKCEIDAEAYFQGCENILGKDSFGVIFPELLALLPDIDRQHELLDVYMKREGLKNDNKDKVINISRKSRNAKGAWTTTQSGFLTCPTCRQVLLRKDFNSHVSQHNLDADFPSLGMESAPVNSGLGFGAWVKAK